MNKQETDAMINKIHFVIENYKENFKQIDEEERYKWEAIGWYKQHWDIQAKDFAAMLEEAFGKTYNLLSSGMYFARKVIVEFAQDHPEDVRALFVMLHDETLSLEERYTAFRMKAEERLKELQKTDSKVKKHDQDLRAIMLYLTFEYPEKYYLFKSTMFDSFSDRVGFMQMKSEQKSAVWKAESFMQLCEIVLEEVKKDEELIELSKARLDESCYQDEALHLLTMDIIYYGSQRSAWLLTWNPANWEWEEFAEWCEGTKKGEKFVMRWTCQSKKPEVGDHVFLMKSGEQPRGIMAHGRVVKKSYEALHYDSEKAAEGITSNGIDVAFDRIQNIYNNESMLPQDYLKEKYSEQSWSPMASGIAIGDNIILYFAKDWKELISGVMISDFNKKLAKNSKEAIKKLRKNKSKYASNMILYGPPGTGKTYNTAIYAVAICDGKDIEEVNEWDYKKVMERYKALITEERVAFTTFHQSYGYEEFIEGIKPQTKPDSKDVFYEVMPGIFKDFCEKAESVEVKADTFKVEKDAVVWKATIRDEVTQDCYDNNRVRIDWGMESDGAAGFVQDMKKGDIVIVNDGSRSIINGIAVVMSDEAFSFGTENDATTRNVQWLAKGLQEDIRSINDGKMLHRMTCCRVPSMKVSDILALAVEKNKDLKNTKIEKNNESHVFIIDEINRGNISKIFGELITLIEDSKRAGMKEEASAILPYSGEKFSVPQNVYIIGTMNTADRSIALMDTALRRRFSFVEMLPDTQVLVENGVDKIKVDDENSIDIAKMLDTINQRITYLYDREHTIGHAFFMKLREDASLAKLAEIFEKSIIPLLQEYFYEDYQKIQLVLGDNAKSDAVYQFIQAKETKANDIFKGAVSLDLDLPEYSYSINKNAFNEAQSYIQIYE